MLIAKYAPDMGSARNQSVSSRRRRLLGHDELKGLLESSTTKLQKLVVSTHMVALKVIKCFSKQCLDPWQEIGGLSVPAEYLISNLLEDGFCDEGLQEIASVADSIEISKIDTDHQEDTRNADLEEFSPRIAQLMASRKTPGKEVGADNRQGYMMNDHTCIVG